MRAKVLNMLQCWLYDAFYQHIPAGRQPKTKKLVEEARKTTRPEPLKSVEFPLIEKIIRDDLGHRKYRVPPTPGDPTVRKTLQKTLQRAVNGTYLRN
ncbi:hypothetical protein TWF481_002592 [Arthrobotrys musiformis]|uniref:Uncharacterized protein n=1 Tax=Arthrobotrys musiformis TaxID=47236 RepID=A0AAV9VSC9_9PEZI